MTSIPQVARAMQTVLTETANAAARSTGFIQRQRAFSGAQFVQTLVFGWLDTPSATYDDLLETAACLGVRISAQGLADRFTPAAAQTLELVLHAAIQQLIAAEPVAIPLLERFSGVYLQDSTTIVLPNALAELWQGCGGNQGRVASALKAQVRLELRTGRLDGPLLQDGRASDKALAFARRPEPGALVIRDLGYFFLPDLAGDQRDGRLWLSRWYPQTAIFTPEGQRHEVLALLEAQASEQIDLQVEIGVEQRVACRLLALRVPQAVAEARRRRLRRQASKKGRSVSAASLALCAWSVVVTSVPAEQLSLAEALVLMRLRWQIELLFKLWKSHGQIDESRGKRPYRVVCEVYAKLLAMLIQHWLMLTTCWADEARSLVKAARVVRRSAHRLASSIGQAIDLDQVLRDVQQRLTRVGRQTRRKGEPNAYQLLLDPSLLGLT